MENKILKRLTKKERDYVMELTEKGGWTVYEVLKKMRGVFIFFLSLLIVMVFLGLKDVLNSSGDRLFSCILVFIMVVVVAGLIAPVRIGAKVLLFRLR